MLCIMLALIVTSDLEFYLTMRREFPHGFIFFNFNFAIYLSQITFYAVSLCIISEQNSYFLQKIMYAIYGVSQFLSVYGLIFLERDFSFAKEISEETFVSIQQFIELLIYFRLMPTIAFLAIVVFILFCEVLANLCGINCFCDEEPNTI
mmetsp:Transcript_17975/g.30591  ORF Transcript_17975/g.30591 Transcript_17975/m.30591 type:complete len:149 (+) Transcript_17975:856-1302(+)